MDPLREFPLIRIRPKDVQFPSCSGIDPERKFSKVIKISNLLPEHKLRGKVPVSLLEERSRSRNIPLVSNLLGMLPVKLFSHNCKTSNRFKASGSSTLQMLAVSLLSTYCWTNPLTSSSTNSPTPEITILPDRSLEETKFPDSVTCLFLLVFYRIIQSQPHPGGSKLISYRFLVVKAL